MTALRHTIISLSILFVFLLGTYYFFVFRPIPIAVVGRSLPVKKYMTLYQIAMQARQEGFYVPFWVWRTAEKFLCGKSFFYAGYYDFIAGESLYTLISMLCHGKARMGRFTIIEGSTWSMIRNKLDTTPDIDHKIGNMSNRDILLSLSDKEHHSMEGLLFPDTYMYAPGEDDISLLRRAHRKMIKIINDIWVERDQAGVPLGKSYDLLVIASLIEKEVNISSEKIKVASVFYNRLRNKMFLQSDPTVCYNSHCSERLYPKNHDLLKFHPHNTYRRAGLPPTPICFPSVSSLIAAAHPDKTSYYYFVAKGDGSSYFSHSLLQHNKAVKMFMPAGRVRTTAYHIG